MYIVITTPHFWQGEAEAITLMFRSGLERLHLRKPNSSAEDYRALLLSIPACYHSRIVLHDHFSLLQEFDLCGVHLNSRNPESPFAAGRMSKEGRRYTLSTSCHSLDELRARLQQDFDYLSISPIYESISKPGYVPSFTMADLQKAAEEGIICERVMALGGITRFNAEDLLHQLPFGGVMVLGDAWGKQNLPIVLSVAGSDPSAGAGVQQDLKTITSIGGYGATAITALTVQNTLGVQSTNPVSAEVVKAQMEAVLCDLHVDVMKIGMVPTVEIAQAIVSTIRAARQRQVLPVVYDPIMLSTSGRALMDKPTLDYVVENLLPLCTLVTPNLPEWERLSQDYHVQTQGIPMLIKGGHADGEQMTDTLVLPDVKQQQVFSSPRIASHNLHGTGCTLSSAIATYLAFGESMVDAVQHAKAYMNKAIKGGSTLHIGHGNGPLWFNL